MKNEQEFPLAIKQLLTEHVELFQKIDGLPHVGSRPNSKEFFHEVKKS